ncbi:metal-dependent hydrolase family protein [Kordiimonas pumila]|uniref:Amidohydrolase family protein n=1 Tax=Kordiimonas pumila TaxID=2161677 RepID=A0ABV7D0N4_9PROT|nr:amidohydrolase family protein [Kordiimonas pumila]
MAYQTGLIQKAVAAIALAGGISSLVTATDVTVIYAGELLAVPGKASEKNKTVVIKDGIISEVRDGFADSAEFGEGAKLVDLKNSFVMPGMMDMHVHLQGELGPKNDSEKLRFSDADNGMHSVLFAKRTLDAGFTTVRDLGSEPTHIFALRDAAAKGWVAAPRIIAAGSAVAATGGHGDVDGMRHDLLEKYTPKTICDGADDCRHAVRTAVKYGADVIKITATGGVLSDTNTGTGQQMTDDELKEVMDTAHSLGRKVAAHAHDAVGINAALKAGVDSIEHGSYADAESVKLFKKTGAYLVPTLLAGDTVVKMAEGSDFMPTAIKEKAIRVGADLMKNFSNAYKAGVKIAYGTDSGVSHHGDNAKEAILMEKAGMPAMEVLKSATVNTADLISMSDKLGTLEAGKYADIIAMDGSPLADLHELLDVDFVMKSGVIYKQN